MRILALCSLAVAVVLVPDIAAIAREPAWCAAYRNGSNNCGFYTHEQCMAAVSGIGGYCNRNPDAAPERPAVGKERKVEPAPKRKEKEKQRAAPAQKSSPPPAAAQPAPPPAATAQPQPAPPPAAAQPAPPPAAAQPPASAAQQQANFGSARALILSGKYEAGIAAMKALGYDDHPDVAGSIGFSYAKLGNLDEARTWYSKALAADPNHLATLGNSGALYVVQGDLARARSDLDRIKVACGGATCREYRELESLIAAKGR